MRFVSAALSDTGRVRTNNEDAFFADDRRCIYAVADGMGGHNAGEVASAIAIDMIAHPLDHAPMLRDPTLYANAVFTAAHKRILQKSHEDDSCARMGTTLTLCGITPAGMLHVAHAGDSMLYVLRKGVAKKITEDQSRAGYVLLNCLGVSQSSFSGATHYMKQLQPRDVVVLASDGLGNILDTQRMTEPPLAHPQTLARLLIAAALAEGGRDNVTVVCVSVV